MMSCDMATGAGTGLETPVDRISAMTEAPNSDVAHVLGMTVSSNSALTSNPASGVIAYPAGSMLILLDSVKKKQTSCVLCPGKTITALDFSPDGKLLLTGESGHRAQVRVWRVANMQEVASFGQFTCIESVSFTPSMREIVVVGNTHDMVISVWSWPGRAMLSLNKFSDNVSAMSVSDDGSFFVTAGNRHIKFYFMEFPDALSQYPIPLPTKIVVLEILRDTHLCDVICSDNCQKYIFALSASGVVCQIGPRRVVERWAHVGCKRAFCLATDDQCVFVGCNAGEVWMYTACDLQPLTRLPLPHSLGVDIAQYTEIKNCHVEGGGEDILTPADNSPIRNTSNLVMNKSREELNRKSYFPGVKAMVYDKVQNSLTSIYDDCSLYVWKRTQHYFVKKYSSLFHCGCIWDFTVYPSPKQESRSWDETQGGALPPGSLITVSADGTLRSWDVTSNISVNSSLKRNPISSACLKIVYPKAFRQNVLDGRDCPIQGKTAHYSTGAKTHATIKPCLGKEGRDILSVVAVCHEGVHIATGNRRGQICIYDAYSMETLTDMVAHEAEVTVISYTSSRDYKILASGSRDRMIHLMDAKKNYELMSTLDDHSSTITAINFTYVNKYFIMVSSSLDMSVLARTYVDDQSLSFSHVRAIVEKKAVVDFTIHPWSGQLALVCQDKMVHIKNITKSQECYSYRGCTQDGGQLVKISTDPSGLYILTACTKKTINLIEFETGEILKTFWGHAEGVTRVQFSLNMKYVISSSSDGCIFFWKLPMTVAYSVKLVMAEMGLLTRGMVLGERWKKSVPRKRHSSLSDMRVPPDYDAHSARDSSSCIILSTGMLDTTQNSQMPLVSDKALTTNSDKVRLVKSEIRMSQRSTFDPWEDSHSDLAQDKVKSVQNLDRQIDRDSRRPCQRYDSMDSLMTTCCRRRELFKLEAKSIKRVLTMMRVVADAMEKDLLDNTFPSSREYTVKEDGGGTSTEEDRNPKKTLSTATALTLTPDKVTDKGLFKCAGFNGLSISSSYDTENDDIDDDDDYVCDENIGTDKVLGESTSVRKPSSMRRWRTNERTIADKIISLTDYLVRKEL